MAIGSTEELKEYIQRRLGSCVVGVELSDDQLDDAVTNAKEWWQSWVGQCKVTFLTLRDYTEYAESEFNDGNPPDDIDDVVNVVFPVSGYGITDFFAWADVEWNPYTYIFDSDGGYGTLVQYLQYREQSRRIVSADRDWEWVRAKRSLIITPKDRDVGRRVEIFYISKEVELSYLTVYEWRVFREYATAQAMKTLAMIRMKFADKPSTTGGFTMDGDTLWANAEAMEMASEDKMRMLQSPVEFWAI